MGSAQSAAYNVSDWTQHKGCPYGGRIMDRSGECMCGSVAFVARGLKPEQASVCHCGMCQRWAGGAWIAVFVETIDCEKEEGLTWIQSSKWAERGFCNRCGSSLFWRLTAEGKYQGTTSVALGALDDRSGVTITKEWFIDRKPNGYAFEGERECVTEAEAFAMLNDAG